MPAQFAGATVASDERGSPVVKSRAYRRPDGRQIHPHDLQKSRKIDLAPVEPAIPYLVGATGPLRGANLMFTGKTASDLSVSALEERVVDLGKQLGVGMQPMEDSLCNWQKSPESLIRFRG